MAERGWERVGEGRNTGGDSESEGGKERLAEKRRKAGDKNGGWRRGTGSGIKMRVVTDGGRIFHLIPGWWKNCICPRQPLGFE